MREVYYIFTISILITLFLFFLLSLSSKLIYYVNPNKIYYTTCILIFLFSCIIMKIIFYIKYENEYSYKKFI